MTLITAQAAGGLASSTGTWVGGIVPVDGDTIKVPAGTTVTWDITTRTLGNKATGVGNAVQIMGSLGSPGKLILNSGCTLTLRGFDRDYTIFGNACLHVQQYAEFAPAAGATILFDVASDAQSVAWMHGILTATGTDDTHRVTFSIPAANRNWNVAASGSTGAQTYEYYDQDRKIGAFPFFLNPLSNAAGTGIGTFGDSSVAFSAQSPASILTTPVASITLVNSAGKYYVDHDGGQVYFYLDKAVATSFSYSWTAKRLTYPGVAIVATDDTDGNQVVTRWCEFDYMGNLAAGEFACVIDNKYSAVGTNRTFEATNNVYKYGRGIQLRNVTGTAAAPIKIEDSEFVGVIADGFGGEIGLFSSPTAYVSLQRNRRRSTNSSFFLTAYGGGLAPHANWTIKDNAVRASQMFKGGAMTEMSWPDLLMEGNLLIGGGSSGDTRQVANIGGTVGHPALFQNNVSWRAMRILNYTPYATIIDNVLGHAYHHSINPNYAESDIHLPGLIVQRNLQLHCGDSLSDLGYNTRSFTDGGVVTHNTIYNNASGGALAYNFPGGPSVNLNTGLLQSSNLIATAPYGVRRDADAANRMTKLHLAGADYNNFYNLATALASGTFLRFSTVAGIANVTGVSLSNPTFTSPVSGKSLVFTRTSGTNQTLAFDGGTAVQLVQDSGTATSATNETATTVLRGTLSDTGKTWSDADYTNAACPVGNWVVITGGTGVGQVRRVTDVASATQLVVTPKWTTVPTAGSTYAIVKSEVLVTGTAGTMNAGIDARVLPSSSQTDSAVAVTFNGLAVDPQLVAPTRTIETWDTSLGGPGTEESAFNRIFTDPTLTRTSLLPYFRAGFTPQNVLISTAAHDGTTIGAIPYVAPPFAADHLLVTTQPSSPIASGASHATQPIVAVKDAVGNTVTGDTSTITATLVVETGSATPLGTLTKVAAAGVANYAANGLGGTSVAGATAHWSFARAGLPSVNSASFTITPGGVTADQFVVIAGLIIPVLEGQAIEQLEQGGSSQRAQAGNLLSDCPWEKRSWQVTTGLLTIAETTALKTAIAFRAHVFISGLMPGGSVLCEVTWSNGAYINTSTDDGTGILRSLVLLCRQV